MHKYRYIIFSILIVNDTHYGKKYLFNGTKTKFLQFVISHNCKVEFNKSPSWSIDR